MAIRIPGGGGGSGSGGGATTALDNLASVAINTSLISDTANTDDLGSTTTPWRSLYAGTSLLFPGVNGLLDVTEPAATTGASVAGKTLTLRAADAVASTDTAGAAAGGDVTITAGAAARLTSGNANGGNINLTTGAGIGTGTAGSVLFPAGTASVPSIAWSADNDGTGTGFYRDAANSIAIATNGSKVASFGTTAFAGTGVGLYGFATLVTNRTSDGSENSLGYHSVLANAGATGLVTRTLPSAAAGGNYTFIVTDADGIKIQAATGDDIRVIDKITAAAGYISSTTIGSVVTLVAVDATTWVATSIHGEWSDGTFSFSDVANTTP